MWTCMPSCLSGWPGGLKILMDVGSTPLEGSPLLKRPFVLPPTQPPGWSLGKGFPSYCFFETREKFSHTFEECRRRGR